MRSRVSMTMSRGRIRFLRSASRNSATVFASTPALRAPLAAVRDAPLAAFRARCWRPRACPPLRAAAWRALAERAPPPRDDERPDDELERDLLEPPPLRVLRLLSAMDFSPRST